MAALYADPERGSARINTGEVVVRSIHTGAGQVEYTPIGHTTNLASRMQTAAPVGAIAASEATRKLCEGYRLRSEAARRDESERRQRAGEYSTKWPGVGAVAYPLAAISGAGPEQVRRA